MIAMSSTTTAGERFVVIPAGGATLSGTLAWPVHPCGVVLFAHGSGSDRSSPRNRFAARELRKAGLATLLFDLLTETETTDRTNVFDVALLAQRVLAAVDWLTGQPEAAELPLGVFGASTGAAAALAAATMSPNAIGAIVSRGGRPDLAGAALSEVQVPTLLIVGGQDQAVVELNRAAVTQLAGSKRLVVIPGAGHLFEEPGALEAASRWAAEWFVRCLAVERRGTARS